jgi:hypothetical protein
MWEVWKGLVDLLLLRLLLNRGGRMRHSISGCRTGAVSLRLGPIRLWLVALVVIVLINIYVTSGWLMVFGTRRLLRWRGCL